MSLKKLLRSILCIVLCACVAFSAASTCFALTYETQYEYDTEDHAWLSDLTVKDNVSTIGGVVTSLKLTAKSDYPYNTTAKAFKNDVDYYTTVYLLDEGSSKAAYVYFFELLASSAGLLAGEVSDGDIANYLKSHGVKLPSVFSSDDAMIARAIYAAMVTGTIKQPEAGSSLEDYAVEFIANMSGVSVSSLGRWLDSDSVTLDDYILAGSKLTLWSAGYLDEDEKVTESDVYKRVAVMTIESYGLTADANSDFDTLKNKFMAAMLGTKYNVSVDPTALGKALADDSAALYILRLLGNKNNVSVGNRSLEDAFLFVAANSDIFDLEDGEFYADIYNYDTVAPAGTAKLWINPVPVYSENVIITCNGEYMRPSYYTAVELDPAASVQTLNIVVKAGTGASAGIHNYKITVHLTGDPSQGNTDLENSVNKLFYSSTTLLAAVLPSIGTDASATGLLGASFTGLNEKAQLVMGVIAPSFDGQAADVSSANTEEYCISFLDKIGSVIDSNISGIGGLDIISAVTGSELTGGLVSFN